MTCYHPLRAAVLGTKPDGKKIIKVLPGSDFTFSSDHYEYINLPCGHCIGCRLRYSRIWADRCMAEAQYHDSNLFLTLTYNDANLPEPLYNYDSDGVVTDQSCIHPLVKRDVQLFIKRLRKALPDQDIRYFMCGEYGPKNMRPHYHLILFGLYLNDLEVLYRNSDFFTYYTSDTINKLWYTEKNKNINNPNLRSAGFHIITSVNWNTCAYVARYIMKKQYGAGASVYADLNYTPEFTLMSRKPGIGRQFYEDHKTELYGNTNGSYVSTEDGAHKIMPNRYYDRLYDIDCPAAFAEISDKRKQSMLVRDSLKFSLSDQFFTDILLDEEENVNDKVKALKRGDLL